MSIAAHDAPGQHSTLAQRLRRWELWSIHPVGRAVVLLAELAAGAGLAAALVRMHPRVGDIVSALALVGLHALYLEATHRVDRLRRYLYLGGPPGKVFSNTTSVWIVAGLLLLPAGLAALVTVGVYGHILARGGRVRAVRPYRVVFAAAAGMIGVYAAEPLRALLDERVLHAGAGQLAALTGAVLLYSGVSLAVILAGTRFYLATPIRELLPSRDDANFEIATMILGIITAVLIQGIPLAVPLVLFLIGLLHRSTLTNQLEYAARHDTKTGLLNSGTWRQLAEQNLQRAEREHHQAALLLFDLDRFKRLNDTHGHAAGDQALRVVAECLRHELRSYDAVGRFGGEEFTALLPNVAPAASLAIAERIRTKIADLHIDGEITVTVSIGIASYPTDGHDVDGLFQAADIALYQAKADGRNRTCAATPATR